MRNVGEEERGLHLPGATKWRSVGAQDEKRDHKTVDDVL